ncbi:MAG: restriction endonuclease subunit S [Candidatus Micrarchaeaceae archaeon]
MAVVSVVKLSELEGTKRMDAEYYQPEYMNLISRIKNLQQVIPLRNLIREIISGSYIDKYVEKGVLYLRVNNLTENGFDFSDVKFVDVEHSKIPQKIRVNENDLVFGRTGTIGIAHVVPKELDGAVMSQHITKIVPKFTNDRFYLMAYLNTKFARLQAQRVSLGSMQVELTLEGTRNLLVFYPHSLMREEINLLISQFYESNKRSQEFYAQAQSLFLSELGLQNFKADEKLSYEVSLSETSIAHRIDAEYFSPKYNEVIEKINKKAELKTLKEFIISVRKGVEVGAEKYQEEGIPFIRVSNLSINGFINKDQKYIAEEDYQLLKDRFEPGKGEILLTKDATPGISYFVKEPIKGIISSGILRLKVKDIDPEYLCLCINSVIGKSQVERDCGGSVITHWKLNQIENLLIPILSPETQRRIAELVRESHEARKKAKELLEEGKKRIEKEIMCR